MELRTTPCVSHEDMGDGNGTKDGNMHKDGSRYRSTQGSSGPMGGAFSASDIDQGQGEPETGEQTLGALDPRRDGARSKQQARRQESSTQGRAWSTSQGQQSPEFARREPSFEYERHQP